MTVSSRSPISGAATIQRSTHWQAQSENQPCFCRADNFLTGVRCSCCSRCRLSQAQSHRQARSRNFLTRSSWYLRPDTWTGIRYIAEHFVQSWTSSGDHASGMLLPQFLEYYANTATFETDEEFEQSMFKVWNLRPQSNGKPTRPHISTTPRCSCLQFLQVLSLCR